MNPSWHQLNAARRAIATRNIPAHIVDYKRYGFFSLCGTRVPQVTIKPESIGDPANEPICKKCLNIHNQKTSN